MEAICLAQTSEEGREVMERGITQAILLRLNRYALENGLITEEIYRKMEVSIRVDYDKTVKQLEQA